MDIQAVTVCIDYSDFLSETIKYNLPLFDNWVIVTSFEDKATQDLCRKQGIKFIVSNEHRLNNHPFNKGRLVERGIQHLGTDCWKIHVDADIALPSNFKKVLKQASLNEECVYGCDRIMVRNWEDWLKFQKTGFLTGHHKQNPYCINIPTGYTIGARWASYEVGYVPIGFFQLWHSSSDEMHGVRVKSYPTNHNTACRTDVKHSLQWDRSHRILIPELYAVHLESELCENGKNWKGRKTKFFGAKGSESPANKKGSEY